MHRFKGPKGSNICSQAVKDTYLHLEVKVCILYNTRKQSFSSEGQNFYSKNLRFVLLSSHRAKMYMLGKYFPNLLRVQIQNKALKSQ